MPRLKLSLTKAILRAVGEHGSAPLGRPEVRAAVGGTEQEIADHLERLQEFGAFNYSRVDEMHRETWAAARYQYRLSPTGEHLRELLDDTGE